MRRVTLLAATALAAGLFAAISPAIAQETGEGDAITVQPLDGDKALELVTSAEIGRAHV